MDAVLGFQGAHRFLSNFYPCSVVWEERDYLSSEAAYQHSKLPDDRKQSVDFSRLSAREARTQGQLVEVRPDWDSIKLNVMYRILRAKFSQNRNLAERLQDTGDAYLEETNYWHDTFWGIYNGVGENHLGRLLMVVRDELNEGII